MKLKISRGGRDKSRPYAPVGAGLKHESCRILNERKGQFENQEEKTDARKGPPRLTAPPPSLL